MPDPPGADSWAVLLWLICADGLDALARVLVHERRLQLDAELAPGEGLAPGASNLLRPKIAAGVLKGPDPGGAAAPCRPPSHREVELSGTVPQQNTLLGSRLKRLDKRLEIRMPDPCWLPAGVVEHVERVGHAAALIVRTLLAGRFRAHGHEPLGRGDFGVDKHTEVAARPTARMADLRQRVAAVGLPNAMQLLGVHGLRLQARDPLRARGALKRGERFEVVLERVEGSEALGGGQRARRAATCADQEEQAVLVSPHRAAHGCLMGRERSSARLGEAGVT